MARVNMTAWLSHSLYRDRIRNLFRFLFCNLVILIIMGYFVTRKRIFESSVLVKEYFIVMNLMYYFIASYLIHFPWKGSKIIHDHDRRLLAPGLFIIMLIQCVPLVFYNSQPWLGIIFIFTYFLGNTFLPVFFTYGSSIPDCNESEDIIPFDVFCRKFDVSPRESDVIRELCKGLSNKEISEKLFISLQTVKDHTHRIYIKTNVKNRVQLINLVKEMIVLPVRSSE